MLIAALPDRKNNTDKTETAPNNTADLPNQNDTSFKITNSKNIPNNLSNKKTDISDSDTNGNDKNENLVRTIFIITIVILFVLMLVLKN